MKKFILLCQRELNINLRHISNLLINVFFYIMGASIFMIALGSDPELLSKIGHAIIWTIILFTIILSSENFFLPDFLDGSIKELKVTGFSYEIIILSKLFIMWVFLIIPILFVTPFLSLMMQLDTTEIKILAISIFLGSPTLLLISSSIVLISIQSKNNKILLILLALPLYLPILIFGVGCIELFRELISPLQNFFILIAIFLITLPITIFTGKLAIKEIHR